MMKKSLLLGLAFGVGISAMAQTRVAKPTKINPALANKAVPFVKTSAGELTAPYAGTGVTTPASTAPIPVFEKIIGTSVYDLQSNSSTRDAIVRNADGSIAAVWTMSAQSSGYSDRGTGYNYSADNGLTWGAQPTARVESERTGWPNIGTTATGAEVILTHDGTFIHQSSRPVKGTGTWTEKEVISGLWPRLAVGGPDGNSLHVINTATITENNQTSPIYYSRSLDGGATWDKVNTFLAGIDETQSSGYAADAYAIHANGNNVAIVVGGFTEDVVLLKSSDNGASWTKTIVYDFPITPFAATGMTTDADGDGVADTLDTNDGAMAVLVDQNGMAHVTFGAMRVLKTDGAAAGVNFFPYTDGLMYWNEARTPGDLLTIGYVMDVNGNGIIDFPTNPVGDNYPFGLYYESLSSYPTMGLSANGTIYVAYQSVAEDSDTLSFAQLRNHIYVVKGTANGTIWGDPVDVVPSAAEGGDGEFQEGAFPSMAKVVDGNIHLVYQRDDAPGLSGVGTGTVEPDVTNNAGLVNNFIYARIDTADIPTSVKEVAAMNFESKVSVYPNPSNSVAKINLTLAEASNVTIAVYNVVGQAVAQFNSENRNAGVSTLNLNVENYKAGIYFVKSTIGNKTFTNKLIVE